MASFRIVTTFRPPFQMIERRQRAAQEKLRGQQRESIRELGRILVVELKREAPKGKTGKFAKGHTFKTFEKGKQIELRVYIPMPLGAYIIRGTKPHTIAARKAGALYFFFPKAGMYAVVPKKGGFRTHVSGNKLWIGKGFVFHPGTKPNPYQERALRTWRPHAIVELKKMGRAYVIAFKS